MFEDIIGEKERKKKHMFICIVGNGDLWSGCKLYEKEAPNFMCKFFRENHRCACKENPSKGKIL